MPAFACHGCPRAVHVRAVPRNPSMAAAKGPPPNAGQTEWDMAFARKLLDSALEQLASAQKQVTSAQEQVAFALKLLDLALKQLASYQKQLDRALEEGDKHEVKEAEEKVKEAEEKVKEAEEKVKEAKAEVKEAKVEVKEADREAKRLRREADREPVRTDAMVQELVAAITSIDEGRIRGMGCDESKGMAFRGRTSFFDAGSDICKLIMSLLERPPVSIKETVALVYSSISGSGKTVSMLRLKVELPPKLPADTGLVVAYLGFNSKLPLDKEEVAHIKTGGEEGAREVLARRLLGSVLISKQVLDPNLASHTYDYDAVFKGQVIPTVEQSKEKLVQELGNKTHRFVIVAGVDEVQLLNEALSLSSTSAEAGGISTNTNVGLGQLFLRYLRQWQLLWWQEGLVIVPLGTGILPDFPYHITLGSNRRISGSDAVLLSREDFRQIVKEVVGEMTTSGALRDRVGALFRAEAVIEQVAAVLWPRVRLVQWWRDGELELLTCAADSNGRMWPEWMELYLLDETLPNDEGEKLPGYGPGGKMYALFQLCPGDRLQVIPDGHQASTIVEKLAQAHPVPDLYEDLKVAPSVDPRKFYVGDDQSFQKLGFSVLGASMFLGMKALRRQKPDPLKDSHRKRLRFALWLREAGVTTTETPVVLGRGFPAKGDMYPYSGEGDNKNQFNPDVQDSLREALGQQRPIFISCGRRSPNDYAYLFPRKASGGVSYVLVIADAKYTNRPLTGSAGVTTGSQIQLFGALMNFANACRDMDFPLDCHSVKLCFLTNREQLAEPEAGGSPAEELAAIQATAKGLFPNAEQELINKQSFEFEPFSSILFARLP